MSISEKIKGGAQELGGKIKQGAGRALNDEQMAQEGALDEVEGQARQDVADVDNKVSGTVEHLKGRAKSTVGAATGDRSLEGEGKLDELKGKIQKKVSNL